MSTTVDEAIEVLNRIHALDPDVLPELIAFRASCNQALADDPTVQVGPPHLLPHRRDDSAGAVGLLGILNGIFGIRPDGKGFIAAYYDDDKNLVRFERTP